MEGFPEKYLIPVGVVTAALIAGLFSFLNLVISKEQKVSEFRQAWIDNVRDEVAAFVSAISYIASVNKTWLEAGRPEPLKHHETVKESFDKASQAYTTIFLRINPDDSIPKIRDLNRKFLEELAATRSKARVADYDGARGTADSLCELMKPILKYEWERVKKGERIYRIARNLAFSIAIAGLLASAFFAYSAFMAVQVEISNALPAELATEAELPPVAPAPGPAP